LIENLKIQNIFKISSNDTSYKICVHTRVGDFKGNGETKIEEINKIMENLPKFVKNYLVCI